MLAYKHAGYVNAWIAHHLGSTENTLKRYPAGRGRLRTRAVMIQEVDYREDFGPVTTELISDWPEHLQQWWARDRSRASWQGTEPAHGSV